MSKSRFSAALMFALLTGCAKDDGPKVVRVTGVVTRNGLPVPNITLHFHPDFGRPSWAKTDDNGKFVIFYDRHQDGAVVGNHKVYVEIRPSSPEEEHQWSQGKGNLPADRRAILKQFGNPSNPTINIEIVKDGQVLEIKLDSAT